MKEQEIIRKSDGREMKIFKQAVTGKKLMTESQVRKMERNAFNSTEPEQLTFKGLNKMTEESVYQYVHYGFPSSPEVSSEEDMGFSND